MTSNNKICLGKFEFEEETDTSLEYLMRHKSMSCSLSEKQQLNGRRTKLQFLIVQRTPIISDLRSLS